MQESTGRLGPRASLGKLKGCEEGGGGGLGRGEVKVMGQERQAAGSRAPLSQEGGAASGRGPAGGVRHPGLDWVRAEGLSAVLVRRNRLLGGVERGGVGGGVVGRVASLRGSDF